MMTARLPTETADGRIMIAVAREEPTVVRGPDYRLPTLGQKPAEKGIIQEVSMHIVDMHDVGVDFPDSLNQLFRRPPGNQSMRIEQPRRQPMKAQIQFVSYRNQLRSMGRHPVTSPAISNVTLPAGSQRQVAQSPIMRMMRPVEVFSLMTGLI